MINLEYADTDTQSPTNAWRQSSDTDRNNRIITALQAGPVSFRSAVTIVAAKTDGQVIVSLLEPKSADKRGQLLLDLEVFLKDTVDQGITVWLEALGDRNSLRNLRGIEVKS